MDGIQRSAAVAVSPEKGAGQVLFICCVRTDTAALHTAETGVGIGADDNGIRITPTFGKSGSESLPPRANLRLWHGRMWRMCGDKEEVLVASKDSKDEGLRGGLQDSDIPLIYAMSREIPFFPYGASSLTGIGGRVKGQDLFACNLLRLPVSRLLQAENVKLETHKLLLEKISPVLEGLAVVGGHGNVDRLACRHDMFSPRTRDMLRKGQPHTHLAQARVGLERQLSHCVVSKAMEAGDAAKEARPPRKARPAICLPGFIGKCVSQHIERIISMSPNPVESAEARPLDRRLAICPDMSRKPIRNTEKPSGRDSSRVLSSHVIGSVAERA